MYFAYKFRLGGRTIISWPTKMKCNTIRKQKLIDWVKAYYNFTRTRTTDTVKIQGIYYTCF